MQSEQINLIAEALSKVQGAMKNPVKNKTVTVRTKTGGSYEFQYADLAAIMDVARKPLSDNGLSYVQLLEQTANNGKYRLNTKLMHASGQWIDSSTPLLVQEADSQSFGSALTFMRRYALSAMLGIAAEDDDDANAADGNQAVIKDKPKPKIVIPPPTNAASRAEGGRDTDAIATIATPEDQQRLRAAVKRNNVLLASFEKLWNPIDKFPAADVSKAIKACDDWGKIHGVNP